jgi:hypothetical protein
MAVNYSKPLPQDRNNAVMTNSPPQHVALQATARETAAVSSVTALNANCTLVEVTAVGGAAVIKWVNSQATSVISAASGANFDNSIGQGRTRLFVVPRFQQARPNDSGIQNPSVVGLNTQEGLYSAIATIGVGSVLLAQF